MKPLIIINSLQSAWSPSLMPENLKPVLWLDAANFSSINFNTFNRVNTWQDLSGFGNNAREITTNLQATYLPTGLNNRPTLAFAPEQRLEIPHSSRLELPAYTIFAVVADDGVTNSGPSGFRAWIEKAGSSSETNRKLWLGVTGLAFPPADRTCDLGERGTSFGGIGVVMIGTIIKAPQVVCSVRPETQSSGPARLFQNGTQTASDTSFQALANNTSNIGIGGSFYPWNGRISEILIYNTALSDELRQLNQSYLIKKWL